MTTMIRGYTCTSACCIQATTDYPPHPEAMLIHAWCMAAWGLEPVTMLICDKCVTASCSNPRPGSSGQLVSSMAVTNRKQANNNVKACLVISEAHREEVKSLPAKPRNLASRDGGQGGQGDIVFCHCAERPQQFHFHSGIQHPVQSNKAPSFQHQHVRSPEVAG